MTTALTGYTGYFTGHTVTMLERMVLWEMGQVLGTTISYARFPKWRIRQLLTDRQNMFVSESRCIRKFALLVAKEDRKQYRLPVNCMDAGVIAVKYYIDSSTYEELDLVDTEYLNTHYSGWEAAQSATPQKAYMGHFYGNIPTIGIYPPPDEDGTNYADDPDTGVAVGSSLPAASNNYTGTATGGGTTTLIDTGTTFTDLGLVAGMYVRNVTDGSYAYIKTVATNTLTFAAAATGGTDNTFTAGDSYEILAGEYGVITSWENSDQYIFGSEIGLLANITIPAGNFCVEYVPYPLPFSYDPDEADDDQDADTQYPDIPKLYHIALADGVIADLLGSFHENSKEFQRAGFYEQRFQAALAKAKAAKSTRPWTQKETRLRPVMRRRR